MDGSPPDPEGEAEGKVLNQAMAHAWDWFALHAKQRMQTLNFFLVSTAFLSAAFATSLEGKEFVAAMIGLIGFLSSVSFNRLDARTKDLIEVGEAALIVLESRLAEKIDMPDLKLVELADVGKKRFTTYSKAIALLHFVTTIGFLIGSAYAFTLARRGG